MDFKEFYEELLEYVRDKIDEDTQVNIQEVVKNNDTVLTGLVFKRRDHKMSPAIYLDYYFDQYTRGEDITVIGEKILEIYQETKEREDFDVDFFMTFDSVKPRLCCKVINKDMNKKLLEDVPYEACYDLALVVYCNVDSEDGMNASILIKKEHLKLWGVDAQSVIEAAKENTRQNIKLEIVNLGEMVQRICPSYIPEFINVPEDVPMYVVTNSNKFYGSVFMCFEEFLEVMSEKLSGDYYILPSSIHEIIIIPAGEDRSLSALSKMVSQVNDLALDALEILADHAYLYSKVQKILIF